MTDIKKNIWNKFNKNSVPIDSVTVKFPALKVETFPSLKPSKGPMYKTSSTGFSEYNTNSEKVRSVKINVGKLREERREINERVALEALKQYETNINVELEF